MPIGVPRIIYCWGEELPAQWTDIYNFIFRRRMVFLMQYLDDELCNQICGLLINIHMEDRSKELEKKEMEKSGLFKNTRTSALAEGKGQQQNAANAQRDPLTGTSSPLSTGKKMTGPSFEDLLAADEDLGIEENNTLEQFTLQKITMEWLNWNAQFFDYSDEPYLFYLAEMLSKDFGKGEARMLYSNDNNEMAILMNMFKNLAYGTRMVYGSTEGQSIPQLQQKAPVLSLGYASLPSYTQPSTAQLVEGVEAATVNTKESSTTKTMQGLQFTQQFFDKLSIKTDSSKGTLQSDAPALPATFGVEGIASPPKVLKNHLDVYSPFRLLANFAAQDYNLKDINPNPLLGNLSHDMDNSKIKLLELFNNTLQNKAGAFSTGATYGKKTLADINKNKETKQQLNIQNNIPKLLTELAQKNFSEKSLTSENVLKSSFQGLSQRILRKEYARDKNNIGLPPFSTRMGKASPSLSTKGVEGVGKNTDHAGTSRSGSLKPLNYLDFYSYKDSYNEFKNTQRGEKPGGIGSSPPTGKRQTERTLQEEEAKKVFVIINSFGGSVGNGITVHDALQFIKAGSLTLGLGVAASAASLALAGGTIGERYVTEGCHVMIHQPEGGIQGQASDIWIDSQEIMKIRLDVAEIYSLATYRPRHKILRDLDRDFYLTATETIHYGLADEIATNETMHSIIEMTSKVWDYHDSKQQRLLESRESSNSGLDTQAQN